MGKTLGGWARLWIVLSGLWLVGLIPFFVNSHPDIVSAEDVLGNNVGSTYSLSRRESKRFAEISAEHPELVDSNRRFVMASELVTADHAVAGYNMLVEHNVYIPNSSSREAIERKVDEIAFSSPTLATEVKNKLETAFPDKDQAWIGELGDEIAAEAHAVEEVWPKRITALVNAAERRYRTFLMTAFFFAVGPPLLFLVFAVLIRWVYHGFKASRNQGECVDTVAAHRESKQL